MTENRGCGCWKVGGVGCFGLFILAVLAALIVGLNFDRIRDSELGQKVTAMAEKAEASFDELMEVRAAVLASFPMQGFEVNRNTMHSKGSVTRSLVLTLVNPVVPDGEETEAYAGRVAVLAAASYAAIEEVDQVVIAVQRKVGTGVHLSGSRNFLFPVVDLIEDQPEADTPLPAEAESALSPGESD